MLLLNGKNPAALKSTKRIPFTATNNQTTFNVTDGYSVGDVEVFLNGVRLVEGDDYVASNGNDVVLTSGANTGDSVVVTTYNQFLISNVYTKAESDSRYVQATGTTPMTSYLKTPNYGVSSYSDSATASLEANPGLGESGVGVKTFGRSVATNGGDILYTADSRGAGGRHRFGYWNGTSFTNTMSISSTGVITKPYQPAFRAFDPTAADGSNVTFGSNDTSFSNRNSAWNTGTSLFTCPIAGVYVFSFAFLHGNGGSQTYVRCLFKINGSSYTNRGDTLEDYPSGTSYRFTSMSMALYLNVGDTVGLYNEGRKIYGTSYGSFSGFFVG